MPSVDAESTRPEPARRLPFEERQSQLVDVAERLFVANGYAAVTMEDIARAAGVTRPIVYRHFETREGAYLACVRRARQDYMRRLADRVEAFAHAPPRRRLAEGGNVFFEMLEADRGKWMLLFGSNAVLPGEYTKELADLRFGTIALIQAQLRAEAAGDVPDLLIEAGANAVSGIGERLGHWWLTAPTSRASRSSSCSSSSSGRASRPTSKRAESGLPVGRETKRNGTVQFLVARCNPICLGVPQQLG